MVMLKTSTKHDRTASLSQLEGLRLDAHHTDFSIFGNDFSGKHFTYTRKHRYRSSHLDVGALAVRAVLEDELLQVEEGPLVVDPLPDLYHRRPRIVRESSGAVIALLVAHNESNRHGLL